MFVHPTVLDDEIPSLLIVEITKAGAKGLISEMEQHPAIFRHIGISALPWAFDPRRALDRGHDGAMLYPKRCVVAVCGDGGFRMNSHGMDTAIRLGLDLVVLVLEDLAYGIIRWNQAVDSFRLTFGNQDFVKYARLIGRSASLNTGSSTG